MSTIQQTQPEIALIMANTEPFEGWTIHWLLSKKQVEYILTDIAALPPGGEYPHLQRAQYQEEMLPVIRLEEHYGLAEPPASAGYRYIVTKNPGTEGQLVRAIIRFSHPIRVRKINFNSVPTQITGLKKNSTHVLGAFTLPDNQLLIMPDIVAILEDRP